VIDGYREQFGCVVGYSDHAPGDTVVLGAVARGAKVIEKHFTLNRNDVGPDHPHSMHPDEFAAMIQKTRDLEKALGSARKEVVEEEAETYIVQRRGLAVAKDLPAGHVLTLEDIDVLRPALGIYPKFKDAVVGKQLAHAFKAGEPIRWEDLA
jgi:pseudaminic acid synthase